MEEAKQIEVGETSSSTPSRKVITLEPKLVIKKGISTLGFVFRLFAVFGTIGSALAMGTTQESVVSLTQLVLLKAKYSDLPTLMFFVVANAVAGGYLVLSLPVSIFHIISTKAKTSRIILLAIDTVMLALVSCGASAATSTVYLAHEGNTTANWPPICQQFDGFCERISGSLIGSFCAVILLMLVVINSEISCEDITFRQEAPQHRLLISMSSRSRDTTHTPLASVRKNPTISLKTFNRIIIRH